MSTRRSTTAARLVAAAVLAVGASLVGLAPAGATTATAGVDEAATVLRSGESVYVDPAAEKNSKSADDEIVAVACH